ncbi:RCC1 domain-containing protein 1-like [Bolinopsis microptera]|uniref:RCC1 domain-containing protein 1-like n=1 Tax=Bolinopsis microptera TaxID=2820187 RepID=UPI00307A2FFD
MKLYGCGFITRTAATSTETSTETSNAATVGEGVANNNALKLVTDLESGYKVMTVWGGVYIRNKSGVTTFGYAISPRSTEVLTAGDNTVVYSDHTVSWDGSATSHAALVRSASCEERCVAATCRRVVWGDSVGMVGEMEPYKQPVEYRLEYPLPLRVTALALGAQFTLALGHCGIVWSWGINNHGQLGQGHIETVKEPTPVDYLGGLQIRGIAAGYWHSLAVSEFDAVYAWGWNSKGQLGLPADKTMESEPVALFEEDTEIRKVSCGRSHSAFLDSGDKLYVCGFNKYGQCNPDSDSENLFLDNNLCHQALLASGVSDVVCGPWSTFYVTE